MLERLTRFQNGLNKTLTSVPFVTTESVKFRTENWKKLHNAMNENDRTEFYLDVRKIDWKKYLLNYHLGVRKYLLNQKTTDFIAEQRKIRRLRITLKIK